MKYLECWEKFLKTGNVEDYLTYTACSLEEVQAASMDHDKGEYSDNNHVYRDSFNSHADWRV